jgi:hypothetical protein
MNYNNSVLGGMKQGIAQTAKHVCICARLHVRV